MKTGKLESFKSNVFITMISLLLAFLLGSVIIALMGENPIAAYSALIQGAVGTPTALTISLTKSVPLILTGLAVAMAMKCSVFNIGAEGQLLVGAIAAALFGWAVHLPAVLHIPLTLLVSAGAGMLWAFMPALLKRTRNVHVVISTIMFNYIGTFFVQYLVCGPFKAPGPVSATEKIQDTARLPALLPRPLSLNLGFLVALVMVVLVWFLLNRTTTGYEMRAVGLNPHASRVAGINVSRNTFLALLLSGALAGLAGGIEVTGTLGRVVDGFSPGYGFNGIPVALMAHGNPFGIILSALLLGAMRNGAVNMQAMVGVSSDLVDIIQGLVIIFIGSEYLIRYYIKKIAGGKKDA